MNHMRYRYRYECNFNHKRKSHSYTAVGRYGALQLTVTEFGEEQLSFGLECHYLKPTKYMEDVPSHQHCWILKTPCWHDGTSLYAEENYRTLFSRHDHEAVFERLTYDADLKFYPKTEGEA